MKKISLRTKLSLYSSLLVLGVVSSVGFSLYVAERHYLLQRFQQSQQESVQFLVQIGRESLTSRNMPLLASYLSLLRKSRALTYAMVLDAKGQIVAHTNTIFVGQKPTDTVTLQALEAGTLTQQESPAGSDQVVDLAMPILQEGRRWGTARVGYSQKAIAALVDGALEAARHRIFVAGAVSIVVGIAIAVFLALLLARPIRHLRDGAHQIGEGALDHRIRITSRDELGELANEFNVMAAKLQELDQLKQDFVSNVTHELRSPLTSLRGYVEFLLRGSAGALNDEQRDYLMVIKNNSVRLARFIDNLLDVAKIESRKIELHPENVRPQDIAREMEAVFRPMAEEKEIAFHTEVPPDIPPLRADADKLVEIFTNLLSNAFKFTSENGRVVFSVAEEGDALHFRVIDSGVGIPASALESVFNKFEQVKPTHGLARKTKGTGLGLTIVRGFVEAHGGRVWMESEEGQGSTAHVVLPKSGAAAAKPETPEAAR
ncbi:MAG TPA: ATP-binding protein [Elusimicrobiota bacterium]|nr:ATP-binding protein [Elusimicrobiota bacterium]HMX42198.1 ATP-binding protein [Elusimicrobiota bacterium]HMZ26119.1 ATP-binding protein [Elusimicrobiota bacterium]